MEIITGDIRQSREGAYFLQQERQLLERMRRKSDRRPTGKRILRPPRATVSSSASEIGGGASAIL